MKIDLKTTIMLSTGLALLLNLAQFAVSVNKSSRDFFAPSWALASSSSSTPMASGSTSGHTAATANLPVLSRQAPAVEPVSATISVHTSVSVPSAATVATVAANLANAGLNSAYASLYLAAQQRTGTPWQLLAAIHKVETGQSGNTTRTSYAGATGPMQFMPATFARYATSASGSGPADIDNVADAIMTAGRYLAANGAARGDYSKALYSYNHSTTYVDRVLSIADRLGL